MMEPNLTAYAGWIAGSIALGMLFLWLTEGKRLGSRLAWTMVLGTLLGLVGARLLYVTVRIRWFLEIGLENLAWPVSEMHNYWGDAQGFGLWGAVAGVALAAWIIGRKGTPSCARLLDAMAPSAALIIGLCRFGEFLIGEGLGPWVEEESLCFFPLAIRDEWGSGQYAVFLLEGLTALVIFAVLLTRGRKYAGGDKARFFLILFSSTQILLEALRRDSFLSWQFMRVSQLICALVLLGLLVAALLRRRKMQPRVPGNREVWICGILFAAAVAGVVVLEFAVDKSPTLPVWAAYIMEGICCAVMGVTVHRVVLPKGRPGASLQQSAD